MTAEAAAGKAGKESARNLGNDAAIARAPTSEGVDRQRQTDVGITITIVDGKPVVVDTGVVKHKAVNFEKIDATAQEDRLVLGGDDPVATGFADSNSATSLEIDFGGQGKTVPAGPNPGEGALANAGRGDLIDAEKAEKNWRLAA